MFLSTFSHTLKRRNSSMPLENGSRVAVIGGGPAGSFFSYFLLNLAERMDLKLNVDIYEPRDFTLPAPQGCNMCAGVISETLIQNLATEGINLPASVVHKAVNSYVMHTDSGSQRIDAAFFEKRIGALFRGGGPRGIQKGNFQGLDHYLLNLARQKGANVFPMRVNGVKKTTGQIRVQTSQGTEAGYDLLVVAAGVNTAVLKLFAEDDSAYKPPDTTRTALREYHFDRETIEKTFGDSLHVFLLNIPRLDFGMIVPKRDYVSVCLLGKEIDENLIRAFLTAPAVKASFPEGWHWDQPVCQCMPRVNVHAARRPYGERVVFIGDSGVTRLYKDGLGAAYRAAKVAATCAVMEGVSAEDFQRYYAPFCKSIEADNRFGKLIFFATHGIQKLRFARRALIRTMSHEQRKSGRPQRMSSVLWDTFTGSAPYTDVFLRMLHPAFFSGFLWNLIDALVRD